MRRNEKVIKDKEIIIDVLNRCHIGRLGTIGKGGYPMVKPLNFAYHDETLTPPIPPLAKGVRGDLQAAKYIFTRQKKGRRLKILRETIRSALR